MTDRERRDLRGPVKAVIWETFLWDGEAGALPEKPNQREGLTFSRAGNLLESVSQFQSGPLQRSTNVYDEAGRLRETRWRNSDGTESALEVKYDQFGEPIRHGANVTYSVENGRKVRTEVFEAQTPGVYRTFGFEGGPSQASWGTGNAALASTFYDNAGCPKEMVLYDAEHMQISKVTRTYDERGRVTCEENQALPRLFTGQRGTQGEKMPEYVAQLLARAFSNAGFPMRMTFKYDDMDRVIEQTQEMGLFGYEKTVSFYNDHGDLSKHQNYSTRQGDIPVDEEGNLLVPPPAPERLESQTEFSYQYDDRGNWTRKETSMLHHPASRWESVEKRLITYFLNRAANALAV